MNLRLRAATRSLWIASIAAFCGGVGVVAVQFLLGQVSAGYPPIVQTLSCEAEGEKGPPAIGLHADGGSMLPVFEFTTGTAILCRIEAPGADYATWSVLGPLRGTRSGPLDPTLPCQSTEDFANQSADGLRLSACQKVRLDRPGRYLLQVTAMVRGQPAVDRSRIALEVSEPKPDPAALPRHEPVAVTLRLPAMDAEQTREADLSASFGEHGLLPQSRGFERTVYRLAPDETFVSASFRARSASNASAVRLAYIPNARAVTASFTLRSGSIIDRWRGWVSGTVAVKVRRQVPARDVALPEASLTVPGKLELPIPEGLDASLAKIVLHRPGVADSVEVAPGASTVFDTVRVTARIAEGNLILEAQPD